MIVSFLVSAFLTPFLTFNIPSALVICASHLVWNNFGSGVPLGLPTLMGAAYFSLMGSPQYRNLSVRIAFASVSILCMALFMTHPVGAQAWPYALYWLIPAFLSLVPQEGLFWRALGATFIAHAFGALRVLFMGTMTVAYWYALIPVVFYERLLCALCISVSVLVCRAVIETSFYPAQRALRKVGLVS